MEDQRPFFDRLVSEEWESHSDPTWDGARRFQIRRLFNGVSPRTVLDVGCGFGFHDILMAEEPGVMEVVGIDYSKRSVEAAEQWFPHPKVTRRVAGVFDSDLAAADLVVSLQVIEHLRDEAAFLRRRSDLVRSFGWLAVGTPKIDCVGCVGENLCSATHNTLESTRAARSARWVWSLV
jgi:2-polyprenyl-3-methyl-5-hydroxy-6-metoxy-1,4-benzoquinol methylase